MRVPPNPLGRVVEVASHGPESLLRAAGLLPRVVRLIENAERLLAQAQALMSSVEEAELRIRGVVDRVAQDERAASRIIAGAAGTELRIADLLHTYEPSLQESSKTVAYACGRFGPSQVDAVVGYLEFLPLLQTLERDVMPMLRSLDTVAPDLAELVAVSRAANDLMGSLPGLGRAKKRVDQELERQQNGET